MHWNTGIGGRHRQHTLGAMTTTFPRASRETEALDGGRVEEIAIWSSNILASHMIRKGKSVTLWLS